MKLIIILLFILLFFSSGFSESYLNETEIYTALKNHVEDLKYKKDYKAIIHILDGFIKLNPSSKYLPYIFLEKGKVMVDNLNLMKEGYYFIEKAEYFKLQDIQNEIDDIKIRYGKDITEDRIAEISFYIEKYFFIEQKFPQSLDDLASYFKFSEKLSLIDGYGRNIFYSLKDNKFLDGDDSLNFELFSSGKDLLEKTSDDIYYNINKIEKIDIKFIQANKIDNKWFADIEYYDEKHNVILKKKVQEGDFIKNYTIFGIRDNGIIVTKDRESYIFKKD